MITEILEQHVDELSFLWGMRAAAAVAPHYTFHDLSELDERVEAHLDALRVAADRRVDLVAAVIPLLDESSDAAALPPERAGEVFAATVLATERGDAARLVRILEASASDASLARAVTSGLAWAPFERAEALLAPLLEPHQPASRRRVATAAFALHRRDPGEPLGLALSDVEPRLKARALRAVGQLGQASLLRAVRFELEAGDEAIRFSAAWAGALLGEATAVGVLSHIAKAGGSFAARASELAVRALGAAEAHALIDRLEDRAAVRCAGALGDPARIPWLLERLQTPALARGVGEAISSITGIAVEGALLGKAPADFPSGPTDDPKDPDVAMDPDGDLPWPDEAALDLAAREAAGRLRRGERHLLGLPLGQEALDAAVRDGNQRLRAGAALEMALRAPGRPLLEVRAPAFRQTFAR
jgi:uncharacterized protein (TIGR02270 family)